MVALGLLILLFFYSQLYSGSPLNIRCKKCCYGGNDYDEHSVASQFLMCEDDSVSPLSANESRFCEIFSSATALH